MEKGYLVWTNGGNYILYRDQIHPISEPQEIQDFLEEKDGFRGWCGGPGATSTEEEINDLLKKAKAGEYRGDNYILLAENINGKVDIYEDGILNDLL